MSDQENRETAEDSEGQMKRHLEDEDLLLPGSHGAWGNEVAPPAPEKPKPVASATKMAVSRGPRKRNGYRLSEGLGLVSTASVA